MPYTLNFYDGTTTKDLTTGTYILGCDYFPNNGSDTDLEITESITIHLYGTGAQMLAEKETLENWLAWAKSYYTTRVGNKIYLRGKLDAADDLGSSLIHKGHIEWAGKPPTRTMRSGYAQLHIILTRDNWWAEAENVLPLTNGNGTDITTGLAIINKNDTSFDNWVSIDGGDIEGTIPGPIRVDIENTLNSGNRLGRAKYSINWRSAPGSMQTTLEGEDAVGETPIANSYNSGGYYISTGFSAAGTTELAYWVIPATLLQAAKGNLCKVLLMSDYIQPTANFWMQAVIQMELTDIFTGQWKYVEDNWNNIVDLGTIRFPPYLLSEYSSVYPLNLAINVKQSSAVSHTIYIDAIQILPIDGWRQLLPRGYNTGYQATLTDDGIDGVVYTSGWSTAGKVGNYVGYGNIPMIMPGVDNRLTFTLYDSTIGGMYDPERTASIIITHEPRRRAL